MIRVADYIMQRIADEGVKHLFYVPGGQCVYLCDALRRSEEITGIGMHHEQAAAMAALSYSVYNNNFGACMVTTGCAGTNTLTGILHAYQDSVPMIVLSGQQNYNQTVVASGLNIRQIGIQEADTAKIVAPITKYSVTIPDAEEIAYHLDKAIYLAREGRRGPVWLDIPLGVQNSMVDETKLKRFVPKEDAKDYNQISDDDIETIVEMIRASERPVIHAGQGVRFADAIKELHQFAELTDIPVTFSRRSYDIMTNDDPHNYGIMNGAAGAHRYANFIVQNSDLFICIGSRLCTDTTGGNVETFARAAKKVVVDVDEVEHKKNAVKIDKLVIGDAKAFLQKLDEYIKKKTYQAPKIWIDKCNHWKEIFHDYESEYTPNKFLDAKYAMREISRFMPEKATVVTDAGFTGAAAPASVLFKKNDRLIHAFAQGEMGFSIPGACGPATLSGGPVIAYEGDGSFMMNLQELQTIKRNEFNIKIVIINNNGYSGVRHGQRAHFRGKTIGTDPSNGLDFPDYGKVAIAFGIKYSIVKTVEELKIAIDEMFSDNRPYILEVVTDPDQFDLHNALVMYGKRKVGFRPIEDQSPFLDRDVFFKEMVIEPLETSYGKPI